MEQLHVLGDDADARPQRVEGRLAQVDAAQADAADLGIVEAEEQPREGRLARAGPPEQPEHLARLEAERDVAQDGVAPPSPRPLGSLP